MVNCLRWEVNALRSGVRPVKAAIILIAAICFAGFQTSDSRAADVKWYDFSAGYKECSISRVEGSEYYVMTLSAGDDDSRPVTAVLDGSGGILVSPDTYERIGPQGEIKYLALRKRNTCHIISAGGVFQADVSAYSEIRPFDKGYAVVTLKSNAHKGVMDSRGKLLFTSGEYVQPQLEEGAQANEAVVSEAEAFGFSVTWDGKNRRVLIE